MSAPKYRLTDRGLTISGHLSHAEWLAIGAKLVRHFTGVQWALGDWLCAIPREETWEETLGDVAGMFDLSWHTLRMYRKVAEAFPHDDRGLSLSWSFYKVAVPLAAAQRLPALRKALREGISYTEFVEWVERRLEHLPTTRIQNPTNRARAGGRAGRPARHAGVVTCPKCAHQFRVILDKPERLEGAA